MKSQKYYQLESACKTLDLIGEDDKRTCFQKYYITDESANIVHGKVISPLTNTSEDYFYYRRALRTWFLIHMMMEDPAEFPYYQDLFVNEDSVNSLVSELLKKDYDKYVMLKIILGDDSVNYRSYKRYYKFFLKKLEDIDTIYRWVQRFIELAEEANLTNFSSFYAENALREFEEHKKLTDEMRSTLSKHIRKG